MDYSLRAVFGLDATGIKSELKQLRNEVRDFANQWGAIAFAAAGAAFVALAKGALEMASKLKDSSIAIGINVESLQVLNHLARENGTSQEVMQKALEKTRINLQKATEGGKEQIETLTKLGLSAAKLATIPVEKKFEAIAKSYVNAKDKGVAYNAVSELFGEKIGPKMIQSLEDLAKNGFDKTAESAAKAGQVMKAETIVALEAAQQAIENFKNRATIAVGNIIVNFRSEEGIKLLWLQISGVVLRFGAGILDAIVDAHGMFKSLFGTVGIYLRERVQNGLVDAAIAFATMLNKILPSKFEFNIGNLEAFRLASEDFGDILAREIAQTEPSAFKKTIGEANDKLVADQQKVVDSLNAVDLKPEADKLRSAGRSIEASVVAGAVKLAEVAVELKSAFADLKISVARIGKDYMDQSTTALEGVITRLDSQLQAINRADASRGGIHGRTPEAYILESELFAARKELAERKAVVSFAQSRGEEAARFKFGDTATDKALRDMQDSSTRTATAVESLNANLKLINKKLGLPTT